jgi:L-alanine-DL-glutamate epimerase-like enolase superfamily enzyme
MNERNGMKITEVTCQVFDYIAHRTRDAGGHDHPSGPHTRQQTILTVRTDTGAVGYAFGVSPRAAEQVIAPAVVGKDAWFREEIWQDLRDYQRLHRNWNLLSDHDLAGVDIALWDLAGTALGQPLHHLLGARRDAIPSYASTMCGELPGEGALDSPEAYADFAVACKERGYSGFKLHTWATPIEPDVKRDIAACAAVREAVGPDMVLMLDPDHNYSRLQARELGRALEELDYAWLEEPMNEASMSSYAWLADQLDIPILGPETADGKMWVRAEWITSGACDILRSGILDVGGITPVMKTVHLAESFGMDLELHMTTPGTIAVLASMGIPGRFYERGLLHPDFDYEPPEPWFHERLDPMDANGMVHPSSKPGIGWEIDHDYIRTHLV